MKSRLRRPSLAFFTLALVFAGASAQAANLYWDGNDTTANADGGSGTWDITTTNWDTAETGGSSIAWPNAGNSNIAYFGGTGGTVTLGTNMGSAGPYPNAINVTAGNYVFDLNSLSLSSRGTNLTISSGAMLAIQNGTYQLQTNYAFNVTGTNALTVSAKITGAFDLSKSGGGDVTLTNGTNDFSGTLYGQNGGTVSFSSIKNSGVASAAGAGSLLATGFNNTMAYTGSGDSTNRTFGVVGGGSDTLKSTGSGALVWTGAFSNTKSGASTLTFGGTNALDNEFQGALIDSTAGGHVLSVFKADAGAWKLSGNSSFTGATSVAAGTLLVSHGNALGSTVGSTSVTGASQLLLTGGIAVGTEALTLNSNAGITWNGQTGASLRNYSGNNSWAGTIALGQNTTIAANAGSALTVSGAISGGFNLTKADSGTLTLSGANTYTGTTTIAAGTLQADLADVAAVSGALGNGGTISFTGGTLQYSANSAGTNYSARILNNTTAAIKLDTNGQNVTFGTALSSTNTAGLTKEGAGRLELKMSATAQYTGTTTINGDTLKFAGAVDLDGISSSSININNGASLVIYSDFNRTTLSNSKTFTFGSTGGGSIVYDKGNHLWQSSTGKFVTTGGTQNTISAANGGFINPQNAFTVNFEVADGTDAVDLLVSVPIGSGNYTKSGAGTLSITSFSTLGGGTAQPNLTINAGTFEVGGTARLTTSGQATGVVTSDILNNGVYRHSSSNAQTLSGNITGTGALTQDGAGALTLSGTNTYNGATSVNTGTLSLVNGSHTSAITVASGATLGFTLGSPTTSTSMVTFSGVTPKVSVSGTPAAATLMTASSIIGTPVLDPAIPGYQLAIEDGNTTLKLKVTGGGSYTTWADANGIPGEPASGDFEEDGISNLVEYALGTDPTVSTQPAGVFSGNVITFTKGADAIANGDVSWVIETSATLGLGSWVPQVTQPAGDATATIAYTLTPGSPAKNFARLKVTQN